MLFFAKWQGLCFIIFSALPGADIRIRIRSRVIRIRITEACIRTVIRITAKQDAPKANSPFYHLFKIIACS
jgi:hypothetical protein